MTLTIANGVIEMPPALAEIYAGKYGLRLVAPGQLEDTEWAQVCLEKDGYTLREAVEKPPWLAHF